MARKMILLALHRHFGVVAVWVLWQNGCLVATEGEWLRREVSP
jgi:hypothetical protein